MPDETETTQDTQTQETDTQETGTQAQQTFTEDDVNRIVAERLAKDRKARDAEAKKALERSKLEGEEKAKAEKADAEKERDDALKSAKLAGYRADLKGEVADMETALLIVQSQDKYIKDGAVDVKTLLKDKPFLNPTKQPSAPGGGGAQPLDTTEAPKSLREAQERDRQAGRT